MIIIVNYLFVNENNFNPFIEQFDNHNNDNINDKNNNKKMTIKIMIKIIK